jgi:epoxyqueuosine reductase QueG
MSARASSELAAWVQSIIRNFLNNTSENSMWGETTERAWGDPLIGFSRGDDPLYEAFKEHIGPFHWMPSEIFNQTYPDHPAEPDELTVISWILPITEATKVDNRKETVYPSERWARARTFGEVINEKLRRHVVSALQEAGHDAIAPVLATSFTWQNSQTYGFASNWSERHAAFASGLGTFGLCDGLITPVGKAMRTGSVVARIQIPPTARPYNSHRDYCLFFSSGACRKCASRCPVGAITEAGHDKVKCFEYVFKTAIPHIKSHYGFDGYSCGLCQTGVPCESRIPDKK